MIVYVPHIEAFENFRSINVTYSIEKSDILRCVKLIYVCMYCVYSTEEDWQPFVPGFEGLLRTVIQHHILDEFLIQHLTHHLAHSA